MRIAVQRWLATLLAAVFSAYLVFLAFSTLDQVRSTMPVLVALAVYAVATIISLLPGSRRMPLWMALFNLATVMVMCLLVAGEIDFLRPGGTGYSTWYVGASGALLTITSVRRRHAVAWLGIAFLTVHTVAVVGTLGPAALLSLGIVGSASWVGVAHVMSSALARAARDARGFAIAEREAADWQAAQEAHLVERQLRLEQTSGRAIEMLGIIQSSGGRLTAEQRRECVTLEAGIRDEIRGRNLLDDAVRDEVTAARRRGASVALLDEGGLDDLPADDLARVHAALAAAIRGSRADRIIARTVPEGTEVAVTVVGLLEGDQDARLLGNHDEEDEVELWLEIPRSAKGAARP